MDNYICINGKKAELTKEQLEKLGIKLETFKSFNRQDNGGRYYYINSIGKTVVNIEHNPDYNCNQYNVANYCTDKELLKKRALYEILNRRLWRYSMEHDGDKIYWDRDGEKYYIFYNTGSKKWLVGSIYYSWDFAVFFYSSEIAEKAIKEVVIPFVEENPEFYEYIYGEESK